MIFRFFPFVRIVTGCVQWLHCSALVHTKNQVILFSAICEEPLSMHDMHIR